MLHPAEANWSSIRVVCLLVVIILGVRHEFLGKLERWA
jgi:hypothetical protein